MRLDCKAKDKAHQRQRERHGSRNGGCLERSRRKEDLEKEFPLVGWDVGNGSCRATGVSCSWTKINT